MGGMASARRFLSSAVSLLFPPACPLCLGTLPTDTNQRFCPSCQRGIVPLPKTCCSCCALPFVTASGSAHLCARCLRKTPSFDHVYAAGLYQDSLARALRQYKFSHKIALDAPLAELLDRALPQQLAVDLVVAVPLHRQRLRQRGYNQSQQLARQLCRRRGWYSAESLLIKNHMTENQQDLSARQREKNLRGAFSVRVPLAGEQVLLIDDVMTTGATVEGCAAALLSAGAGSVSVAVIARAPLS